MNPHDGNKTTQYNFSEIWLRLLNRLLTEGDDVAPRGQATKELPHRTVTVNMRFPVLTCPTRQLSYTFMAAEAYWILSGDSRVETIGKYCETIKQFSDDGKTFFGAYGPRISSQLGYVVHKLLADPDTRQAGLTIWRENPPPTKDVPCTVAIFFSLRRQLLNCHVFMRSSDAWLGLPYDVFNFSMLAHLVCGQLNLLKSNEGEHKTVSPGWLYLTAASSHLYGRDFEAAKRCLEEQQAPAQPATPYILHQDTTNLMRRLATLRESKPGSDLRWWEGNNHG